jgi:hypothetical protein
LILPLAKQASSLPTRRRLSLAVFAGFGFFALSAFGALSPPSTSSIFDPLQHLILDLKLGCPKTRRGGKPNWQGGCRGREAPSLAQLLTEELHLVSSQFDKATSIFASFPLPRTTAVVFPY